VKRGVDVGAIRGRIEGRIHGRADPLPLSEHVSRAELDEARRAALPREELDRLHAWWRAANYLSVGQIYLLDNPLLREPLRPEQV
jgi:hypothetical protein